MLKKIQFLSSTILCLMCLAWATQAQANDASTNAEQTASVADSSNYTQTQYPNVLVHGLVGFDSLFFGIVNYWPGIARGLTEGGAQLYIAQTSALNSSAVRGEQLITQIEDYLAVQDATKVNLWGHSQGALDIRYVATVRPDLIASITSIGGPHGAGLGGVFDGSNQVFGSLINFTANMINIFSGNFSLPLDADAGLNAFTREGVEAFRANYPIGLPSSEDACGDGPAIETIDGYDIRVYSWGGTSIWTTFIDPSDALMAFTNLAYPAGSDTDGIVARCDNHLGEVIRDNYSHNHFDLVNQVAGIVPFFQENPVSIFRAHANRLKNEGL